MIDRLRRRLLREAFRGIRRLYRERAVPLGIVEALATILGRGDIGLAETFLEIAGDEDAWVLHPDARRFICTELDRNPPQHVLEFGSGTSTVLLARALRRAHSDRAARLFVIEQDEAWAMRTKDSLVSEDLLDGVRFVVAPLEKQLVSGREIDCYAISPEMLDDLMGPARPDFVLIDGPSGPPGSRYGTLPLVIDHIAPGARFLLDDALRRGELEIAREWQRSSRISIDGMCLVGRGLLTGHVLGVRRP